MAEKLYINTFGGFSMSYQGNMITDTDNRSKKIWTLLEYIVINHDSLISSNSLFDLLWAQDQSRLALENNLKVCLHRVRELLKPLNYPENKLILYKRNHFTLNPDVEYEIDSVRFEEACHNASNTRYSDQERFHLYHRVFELYAGRFLSNTCDADWVIPLSNYYHSLFITTVHDYFLLLAKNMMYNELFIYSTHAVALDEFNEIFQYYSILSLCKTGHSKEALVQYEAIIHKYYDMFGINPSNEFKALYAEIIRKDTVSQDDLSTIMDGLKKGDHSTHAYECNYAIFQHLYQFEARSMARNGICFYLCLININILSEMKKNSLSGCMICLSDILGSFLRRGDVYSRYSTNQYVLLIPSASYENCMLIGERIRHEFLHANSKLDVDITFMWKNIEPEIQSVEKHKIKATLLSS